MIGQKNPPFTFRYYEFMLRRAKEAGFAISSFDRYDGKQEKTVIMRHDVDYTLNGVLQLAEIEWRVGVTATYCFRVHAHEYNLFAPYVYMLLMRLVEMGHEIGLHHEAMTIARAIRRNPREIVIVEKSALELASQQSVKTVSEHRDISHIVHKTRYFHEEYDIHELGFENFSMEPRFFTAMKYLSDSNGIWREGDLLDNLEKYNRFQVLIHPDWWFEDDLLLKGPYFHGLGN